VQAILGLSLLSLTIGLAIYINSDAFRERVRARIVAELERTTGGRVDLESFSWNLSQLRFEARGLTIHGLEGPGEEPYVHAGRVSLRFKITSLLGRQFALREVVTDHLTVHLIVGPDGVTNQPTPKTEPGEGFSPQRLFDLAVNRVEINGGTLILNHERMPLDLSGQQLSVGMTYSRHEHGYEGNVSLSVVSARWQNRTPVSGKIELHVLLRAAEAEIKSLKVSSGRSTLEASGAVRNYSHPEVRVRYAASLDLTEAARLAQIPQLRAGRADTKGELAWNEGLYSTQGDLAVKGLEWRDSDLHLSGMDVDSPFSLTPDKAVFTRIRARIFSGAVEGDAQVENWSAPATARKPQRGTASFRLSRLQISELAAAVSTARLPLEKIGAVGSASGEIKASWTGSPQKAVAALDIDTEPPANPSPQQVPVNAQLHATYHGDLRTLDVASLRLVTRAIRANASGELGSRSAQARLSVNATDLHEIQPALDALRPGTRIPIVVQGQASFEGAVFGDLNALSARGHMEIENFLTEIGRPQAAHEPAQAPTRVHWDSLTADVAYSPSGLVLQRGLLRRGKGQLGFSLNVRLQAGAFDENVSQVALNVRVENASVEDMQALAGLHYPITGIVTADGHVSGTANNLRGSGSLQISQLAAYGEPFQSFRSQVRLEGREVQLDKLLLLHNGAQLTGSVDYNFGNEGFRFDVAATNIDLATMRSLQFPRLAMAGKAGFHLSGSFAGATGRGSTTPVINGRLDITNLALNHEVLGNVNTTLETHGEELVVRGRSAFEDASLDLNGALQLRNDFPGQMTLKFSHVDFDPLLRAYLQGQITGHSSIAGSFDIRGPMRKPQDLSVTGDINQLSANLESVKLQNDGPIHLSMDHEVIRADQFHLVGQDTDLSVRGSMHVSGDHALDLHTQGRVNLRLAHEFNPNILAAGPVTFTVDVRGTPSHPQMSGKLEMNDASVSLADLPNGLSHIKGAMVFAQDRMQIEKLTAQSGGGELNLGGFLAYRNGLYFDLTATGKDVRLRYPPGMSESADANLRYTGSAQNSALTGDVTINRFGMSRQFDFGVFLSQSRMPTLTTLNPFLENLRLDVHVLSSPELQLETSLAKLTGSVDLRIRGTGARPSVLGRVNIAEGDVYFNGTKFRLERGDITFNNPLAMEPYINVDMSARVQNYDLTVGLHGTLSGGKGLTLTYRSDPPLSNDDIIALLAFGRTQNQDLAAAGQPNQTGQPGQTAAASASNAVLGEALNAAVGNRVEKLFGGSRVRFDPQFIGQTGTNTSTRVTVEQQVNNNVTFTYGTSLTQSTETVIQVEYNIDKNLSIVAVRDQNGVLSFDVSIRRRKK
jgi:translocation and assembly module TamB